MKRCCLLLACGLIWVLLSGCWDQRLLKNQRNVSIGGMDRASNGMILATVSIRDMKTSEAGPKNSNETHSVIAKTTQHARELLNQQLWGSYSSSKMRVLLFGEELVKQHDFLPYLDVYYRDPRSPLNARLAVVHGKALDTISKKMIGTTTIGQYLDKLIESIEDSSTIPKVNLQSIHPLDRGYDFALPYLTNSEPYPTVHGIAMFHGTQMTGSLNLDESTLYLLLADQMGKTAQLTVEAVAERKMAGFDYVTIAVQKIKRALKVKVQDDQQIDVQLDLKLKVTVTEDPQNQLYKKEVVDELDQLLSEELTKKSKTILNKMQRAHHDGFGLARRLMAHYPKVWNQVKENWTDNYTQVRFHTQVRVEIINSGIIN
ncbi:Ger(x)C family spore germination protein [Paenibacillus radicis (ex Xue et al. 2023)]|uniref:Ger(X)C family spore germination protein n=1 Tax=Paenibacillus radicis (ex Xue et al. 2023) TaxID=2972489 RepID=A0ABT1YUV1_9BACL|nr:Ger(x)C family spore germination protein [Paenibacillus radicis (ex Xue et al. 2023)]MCR8636465.1 Ger(x)C family spore germination protein [Paenibacillus radicis (ex Xue et al. 2023)]